MGSEMKNLIKVWSASIASLCYCYSLAKRIQPGLPRLVSLLPIIYLFFTLPLFLSSFHFGGPTIFYLVWLANFKLLLFAFDRGPLSPSRSQPPLSLFHFVSIALFPIKTRPETDSSSHSSKSPPNPKNGEQNVVNSPSDLYRKHSRVFESAVVATKVVLLAVIVSIYRFREELHPGVIVALYCFHVYLGVELTLAITAVPVRTILGLEIEPQFNEPYLATSLQDFWGRRWNLMVTSILRPSVYIPVRELSARVLGTAHSLVPAVMATFLVSGLMHEIIYYYLTRVRPTWEVTCFFLLHGVAVVCEIGLKKALNGRWRLPRLVSGALTLGFVAITGARLFFPQLIRNGTDLKVIKEYEILVTLISQGLMMIPIPGQ